MRKFSWAVPLSAMSAFVPPFCSHWPGHDHGGGHGGSAHAGAGAAGEAGTGGQASQDLPVIGCPPGAWPETAQLALLSGLGDVSAGLISGNGEVTLGTTEQGPVFWSTSGTVQVDLPYGTPRATTCDGSLIVGNVSDTIVAFRAQNTGAFSYLPTPTEPGAWATEEDMIAGGLALGNYRYPPPLQPITWDEDGTITEITALRGMEALELEPDGQTIWGITHDCESGCNTDAIFRYSPSTGITRYPLGAIPSSYYMASDGSVVYDLSEEDGVALEWNAPRPLHRFDASTGTELDPIPCAGPLRCYLGGLSTRAAVVIYYTHQPGASFGNWFIFDEGHGVRGMPELLGDLGISVEGTLAPGGMSDDARVLTGSIFRGEGIPFVPFRLTVPRGTFY